jgi:hypothetical protein
MTYRLLRSREQLTEKAGMLMRNIVVELDYQGVERPYPTIVNI